MRDSLFLPPALLSLLLAVFLGLAPTSADAEKRFQPEVLWPQAKQSGQYFNFPQGIARDSQGLFYITDSASHKVKVLTVEGELLRTWGGIGSQPGQFSTPNGIVISDMGEVYVADQINNRIQVFDTTGQFIRLWGSQGSSDGELNQPTNLAIDKQGNILVSDTRNGRIQVFDSKGKWLQSFGEGVLNQPYGMAFSPAGELYIAETNAIRVFNRKGEYLRRFGEAGKEPGQFDEVNNLAFDAQGLLYVTEYGNNRIQVFSPQEQFIQSWGKGELRRPFGLVVDNKSKTVYIADTSHNRILHYSLQGENKGSWQSEGNKPGEFSSPQIAVSPQGEIYAADKGNNRIQVFSQTGEWLRGFGEYGTGPSHFKMPEHVAFDQQQQIYIADFANDRIQIFDRQGNYISEFGASGSGEKQLDGPSRLFIQGDLVYVTDLLNDRVQVFTLDGVWVRGWGEQGNAAGQFDKPVGIVVDDEGKVYIADRDNHRIQVFNKQGAFLYLWGTEGSETGALNSPTGLALSAAGLLYVADTLNNRIQVFQPGGTFVEVIGEAGTQAGQFAQPYTVALIDEDTLVVGEGANNRVQILRRRNKSTSPAKAIILAGGGSPTENHTNALWDSTQLLSNNAYFALRAQGYSKEAIKFLSSGNLNNDLDENGKADDLDKASLTSLEQAITGWAGDTDDVLIYLIDHGGPGTFKINQQEILSREQLKQWVEQLQNQISGKITLIIEACQSASFFEGLGANKRILIASADKQQPAVISNQGKNSFSYHFWYAVHKGEVLQDAFRQARQGMSQQTVLVQNKPQQQNAQLDADGNGKFDNHDYTALGDYCFGRCQQLAADEPKLTPLTASTRLNGETRHMLSVQITSLAPVNRAWAIISRPDVNYINLNDPISDLPELLLECSRQSVGNYSCEAEYPDFDVNGDYSITFHASDTQARVSVPRAVITIKQAAGKENMLAQPDSSEYSTRYDIGTGIVSLYDVEVDGQHYQVTLEPQNDQFVLTSVGAATQVFDVPAQFSFASEILVIPQVQVGDHYYLVNLQLQPVEGFVFKLINIIDLSAVP